MVIDPLLPPEVEEFAQSVRAFAEAELAPGYQERDRTGAVDEVTFKRLAELGLLGLRAPEHLGGQGADCLTAGIACEEVARGDFNLGYALTNASLVTEVLCTNASAEQQERFVPPIARGEVMPALCLTEPEHGSDSASLELRATRDGDDWVLGGEKTSITFGTQAPWGLVFARTGPGRAKGVTAFYADLRSPAVSRSPFADLGGRSIGRAAVHFDDLRVPDECRIGPVGAGFTQVMRGFEFSRALIALICIGAASVSIEQALQYARDRRAFGRPLGTFQGVAFPLVEYVTQLAAAREMSLRALRLKDRGLDHRIEANMVKWWAPRLAVDAAHEALLVFGHSGYSEEYPLGQRIRDIIGLEIGDGTANITKLVIARELLGRQYAP